VIVHCERCETRFELDDARLAGGSVRVRCSHCKHVFRLDAPVVNGEDELDRAVSEALALSPPVIEDLVDYSEGESEFGADEDWEFAGPSDLHEEPGDGGLVPRGESLPGAQEVEAAAPALEPLEEGELLCSPPAEIEAPEAQAHLDAVPTSDFETEEIDDALAALSAWEPEAEDSREPATVPLQSGAAPARRVAPQSARSLEATERSPMMARVGATMGWLAVLFLVAVGLHAGVAVESRLGVAPFPVAELGGHRLSEVDARWIDNLHAGPLLVVSGRLGRVGGSRAEPLALTLLDAEGVALAGRATPLGPALPGSVLRFASPDEIRQQQAALRHEWSDLRPGAWRRFDAVFVAVPDVASELQVRRLFE